jgi:hypothetical protein
MFSAFLCRFLLYLTIKKIIKKVINNKKNSETPTIKRNTASTVPAEEEAPDIVHLI